MTKARWMAWLLGIGLMTGTVGFADGGVYQFSEVERAIDENNSQILRQMADTELLRLQKESLDEQTEVMEPLRPLLGSASSVLGGETALQLVSLTEYVPAQLDMGIRLSELGVELARNSVILGARQLVLGIMQTQQAARRAGENVANQQENWERIQLSYDLGMATEAERLQAKADLTEADLVLDTFEMDNKDYVRRLNQLMGKPIESEFVFLREMPMETLLMEESVYLERALQNRFEIIQLQESLALKEQELEMYDTYGLRNDAGLETAYRRLEAEREQLALELEWARETIGVEVKTAYRQAVIANQQRIALTANRDAKREMLANLKVQRKAGFVSEAVFDGTENALKELEEGVDLLVVQYNTARMALDFASQVGPGAESGVTP